MTCKFDPIYDIQHRDWFADDTQEMYDELKVEGDKIKFLREEYLAWKRELESASLIDVDPESLSKLPRQLFEIRQRELRYRNRRVEFQQLFARDRNVEHTAAVERHQQEIEKSHQRLLDAGYLEGAANERGTFTNLMVIRHPDVRDAQEYVEAIRNASIHSPENLAAIINLEKWLAKVTAEAIG